MHQSMLQLRARVLGLVTAGVLTACGGGSSSPPAPTVIPENLAITAPASAESATAVAFANSAGALTGLKYQWDFGDGTSSTDPSPSHTYASGGEFDVVLKVTNEAGSSRETRAKVSITNMANVRGLDCTGSNSSGWCWQNPRPTGNRVNTVFFIDATTGWRGGDNGEIFKTTDGGATWVRQTTGISASILAIRFFDATTGWATGTFGAVLRTVDGGVTWKVAKLPDSQYGSSADLRFINASDAKNVYIGPVAGNGGFGGLSVSNDGGVTWRPLASVPHAITPGGKFWSLQGNGVSLSTDGGSSYRSVLSLKLPAGYNYFDSSNLWAIDDQRVVALTRASNFDFTTYRWNYVETLYITIDGGANWSTRERVSTDSSLNLQRIVDVSADGTTLLGSGYGALMRSTDGGKTWDSLPSPSTLYDGVSYMPLGGGEIAAQSYSGMWLSKDAGLTWTKLSVPQRDNGNVSVSLNSLRRIDVAALMLSDVQGASFLSRDNGQSWTQVVAPVGNQYVGPATVAFSDAKNGFLLDGTGRLATTKDGGLTWESKVLSLGTVSTVQFVNKQTGWLVGGFGQLYKTTDAGKTWTAVAAPAGVAYATVFFQNELLGWAQRYGGGALYVATRDGGKTWTELALPYGVTSLLQGEQVWVAVGSGGAVYVSSDSGVTWNAVYTGTGASLMSAAFSDAKTVWAVGSGGTVLKSDDAGGKWAAVSLPVANITLRDVKFVNGKVGWIVGEGGVILATQDGGKSWRVQPSGTSYTLNAIQAVDTNTAWVTGAPGVLLATGTGGN